jgi:chromosome segregation ATPase
MTDKQQIDVVVGALEHELASLASDLKKARTAGALLGSASAALEGAALALDGAVAKLGEISGAAKQATDALDRLEPQRIDERLRELHQAARTSTGDLALTRDRVQAVESAIESLASDIDGMAATMAQLSTSEAVGRLDARVDSLEADFLSARNAILALLVLNILVTVGGLFVR